MPIEVDQTWTGLKPEVVSEHDAMIIFGWKQRFAILKLSTAGGFSSALLQLDVVYAVRAVVNSKSGLEFLLGRRQLTRQLVQGEDPIHLKS